MSMIIDTSFSRLLSQLLPLGSDHLSGGLGRLLSASAALARRGLGATQMLVQQTEPAQPGALPAPPKVPPSPAGCRHPWPRT